jgi:hypothetical protein
VAGRTRGRRRGIGAPLKSKVCRVARGAAFRPTFQIMALIVHKYGGTSMGSTERIRTSPSAWPSGHVPATRWWWCPAQ